MFQETQTWSIWGEILIPLLMLLLFLDFLRVIFHSLLAFSLKRMNTWINYWVMSVKSKKAVCYRLILWIINGRIRLHLKIVLCSWFTFPVRRLKPRDIPCFLLPSVTFLTPCPEPFHVSACVRLCVSISWFCSVVVKGMNSRPRMPEFES